MDLKQRLPSHSSHKFRLEITDQFYSNLKDREVQNRISSLRKGHPEKDDNQDAIKLLRELLTQLERGQIEKAIIYFTSPMISWAYAIFFFGTI